MLAAALAVVAAVVGLLAVPWPLWIRVAIFAGLGLCGLAFGAYLLGTRRPEPDFGDPETASPSAPGGHWTRQALIGRQVVKVAAKNGNVLLCELKPGEDLTEEALPLSPEQSYGPRRSWTGQWSFRGERLAIVVRGYSLELHPSRQGYWAGTELFGEGSEDYAGAVVDRDPIVDQASWVGLKLGEHGARRWLVADSDGALHESDPFRPGLTWSGRWSTDDGRLQIITGDLLNADRWQLTAKEWISGVYLGIEHSDEGEHGYAVVRACRDVRALGPGRSGEGGIRTHEAG